MISVLDVLRQNEKEAIKILKKKEYNMVIFAIWDDDEEVYNNADDCPYIRYANDDGEISVQLVVGARYNTEKKCIEILTTENEYKKTDGIWFPINYADDISYWSVLEYL
jgi:hypothetical protein